VVGGGGTNSKNGISNLGRPGLNQTRDLINHILNAYSLAGGHTRRKRKIDRARQGEEEERVKRDESS
jgi:hypothetical protein